MRLTEITNDQPSVIRRLIDQLLDKGKPVYFNVKASPGVEIFSPNAPPRQKNFTLLASGSVHHFSYIHNTDTIYFIGAYGEWVRCVEDQADNLLTLKKTKDHWELTNATD